MAKRYQPIIESPYRWRDWASREDGITGDENCWLSSAKSHHACRWQQGQGLFAYLRGLAGEGEKRQPA